MSKRFGNITPLIVGLLASAALTSGCTGSSTAPLTSGIETATTSRANRPLPSASRTWKGMSAPCPTLSGVTAGRLGIDGEGSPTASSVQDSLTTIIDCRWGSSDGRGFSATLRMSVWRVQAAADAAWRTMSTGQTERIQVGDEGFIADEPDGVVVRTRSGNAVVTFRLIAPNSRIGPQNGTGPALLAQLRQAAPETTNEILAALAPA